MHSATSAYDHIFLPNPKAKQTNKKDSRVIAEKEKERKFQYQPSSTRQCHLPLTPSNSLFLSSAAMHPQRQDIRRKENKVEVTVPTREDKVENCCTARESEAVCMSMSSLAMHIVEQTQRRRRKMPKRPLANEWKVGYRNPKTESHAIARCNKSVEVVSANNDHESRCAILR